VQGATWARQPVPLDTALRPGTALVAVQVLDGEVSASSPDPVVVQGAELGLMRFVGRMHAGGRCVCLAGACPGAAGDRRPRARRGVAGSRARPSARQQRGAP
jgi:hypothetical protein